MDKQKNVGLPIFYIDRTNYVEIAYLLRDLLLKNLDNTAIEASDADIDIADFADYLEHGFRSEALEEFLTNDFGKGMILGSYMEYKLNLAKRDEEQVLEEMENEA
jgi:hypothetical protein